MSVCFTGNASGLLNIQCKHGNISEEYNIFDCLFYDQAVTGTTASWYLGSGMQKSSESDGTTLASSTTANAFPNSTQQSVNRFLDYVGRWCIEFDVVNYAGTVRVRFSDSPSTYCDWEFSNNGVANGSHVRLCFDNNNLTATVGDTTLSTININKNQ